jgi:hypothetical protein
MSSETLKVWEDGEDWVIAASPEDATKVWEEFNVTKREPDADPWRERAETEPLQIDLDNEEGRVTLPPSGWAKRMGRSFLASRNY